MLLKKRWKNFLFFYKTFQQVWLNYKFFCKGWKKTFCESHRSEKVWLWCNLGQVSDRRETQKFVQKKSNTSIFVRRLWRNKQIRMWKGGLGSSSFLRFSKNGPIEHDFLNQVNCAVHLHCVWFIKVCFLVYKSNLNYFLLRVNSGKQQWSLGARFCPARGTSFTLTSTTWRRTMTMMCGTTRKSFTR